MMQGSGQSEMAGAASAAGASRSVMIVHVQRGCHVWSTAGAGQTPALRLVVKPGTTLAVRNMDVDNHALREVAGPMMRFDRMPLRMNAATSLTFAKAGTYRFTTRTSDGAMGAMPTSGPDNHLRMTVVVS
jgi:plastocyanin